MSEKVERRIIRMRCPEHDRRAELVVECREDHGRLVIEGISCDNPRLADIDNWDCDWDCWRRIAEELDAEIDDTIMPGTF